MNVGERGVVKMKALVVDDSSTMRSVLVKILRQIDITDVDEAADGVQAVDAVDASEYGIVLMDWNMPNMLGIDAVREIRAKGKDMPIIMVSTQGEKRSVLEALKAGANNFIVKPFTPEDIREKITEALEKHAQ